MDLVETDSANLSEQHSTKKPLKPLRRDEHIQIADTRPSLKKRILHLTGVDRAIFFTILGRGWSSLSGILTVILIARSLSTAEQGYYYTFGSLVALQIIFELGFSFVILQLASHECAHLTISMSGVTGPERSIKRLASILHKAVRWYSLIALLMWVLLLPVGYAFFTAKDPGNSVTGWRLPWLLVVTFASIAFQIDPVFSFLEGCGFIADVARTRVFQAIAGSSLVWVTLITGKGLFAPAMLIAGQVLVGLVWLYSKRKLLLELWHIKVDEGIDWRSEVWSFQWRIAISWISNYFIYQFFNPIAFAYSGPSAAGRMGMSLSICTALTAVSISWMNTKAPVYGRLIARKEYGQLDKLFFKTLLQSLTVCICGCLSVWTVVLILHHTGNTIAGRLLDPRPLALLFIATIANHVVLSEALYLRAHRQEKFLAISATSAVAILMSSLIFGRIYGTTGMVTGYVVVMLGVSLGGGTYLFSKYRRLWHSQID